MTPVLKMPEHKAYHPPAYGSKVLKEWSLYLTPLNTEVSVCNTFRLMCDVPSIAVFCIESIECFPVLCLYFGLSCSAFY
jgi:hypothetical protein